MALMDWIWVPWLEEEDLGIAVAVEAEPMFSEELEMYTKNDDALIF